MGGLLGRLTGGLFQAGSSGAQADRLVYAIGDIHGRADLLQPLVENIVRDAETSGASADRPADLVILGDVVGRGPDTRQALDYLMEVSAWPQFRPVCLMGNHEVMLLQFLSAPIANQRWLRHGGFDTLVSYGLGNVGDLSDGRELERIAADLADAMGPQVEYLEGFVPSHRNGKLFFVHAGADPALPPEQQPENVLIWGTDDFKRRRRDGLWVVHGHTVVEAPIAKQGRISVDTGAYMSGILTALKVDGTTVSFLSEVGEKGLDEAEWDD